MYLAGEGRKSVNPFVGHVLSDECNPCYYVRESDSDNQPKEKDMEKVGTVSGEGTLIKFSLEKATEITKDDTKTTQHEKDIQMEVPNAATKKRIARSCS